jgi:phosphate transport system substrate-binding protein
MKKTFVVAIMTTFALVASGCSAPGKKQELAGQGSSYSNMLMQACKNSLPDFSVAYMPTGSGTGKNQFASGLLDFGATDAPYSDSEPKPPFPFGYVAIAGGPIAIVFNLSEIKTLNLTAQNISDIYSNKITKWNDERIAESNPRVKLPSTAITVIFRADGSGTSANFSSYLASTAPSDGWVPNSTSFVSSNKNGSIKGIGAPKSTGVATTIKQVDGAIGYLDLSDALSMGLESAQIQNQNGEFLKPTVGSASKFLSAQEILPGGLIDIDYTKKISGAYNLSLVSYAIVPLDNRERSADLKAFFHNFITICGPTNAAKLGYSVISGDAKDYALETISQIGTK